MKKIITILLCGAVTAASVPAVTVRSAPSVNAVTKSIPVYRRSLDENETVECIFYDDMPNVPYMSLERYYGSFMDGSMSVTANGNGVYTYTESICGDSAQINTQTDTFTTDDLASFVSTPVYKMKGYKYVLNGPDLMIQTKDVEYSKPADRTTIELGRYSIDVREKDGTAVYPFATLSDIFGNTDYIASVYEGGKIYFIAYYDDINGGEAINDDSSYLSTFRNSTRPTDMIEMSYRELCMSLENFYGYPSDRNRFAEKMKTMGLDAALTLYDYKTKQLLLSPSPGSYIAGLYRLFNYLLADGGHTLLQTDAMLTSLIKDGSVNDDFMNGAGDADGIENEYTRKYNEIFNNYTSLTEIKKNQLGSGEYHSNGNAAVISFDTFEVDYQGWRDYFSGKESELPHDSVSIFYKGLLQARSEGKKNVIIDVSTNLGGDTVALHEIVGIISGEMHFRVYNTLGNQLLDNIVIADRDLNGTIDSKDELVSYDDMNFAVLTSSVSFSCGNLIGAQLKDIGVMLIGEQSGGGGCAVLKRATADGIIYTISSYAKFVDKNDQVIDDGVPVDVQLVTTDSAGNKDYSGMYDIARISSEMDAYYAAHPVRLSGPHDQDTSDASRTAPSRPSEQSTDVSQDTQSSIPSEVQASGQDTPTAVNDSGWIGTIVLVFVLFGLGSAALIIFGIIFIVKKR